MSRPYPLLHPVILSVPLSVGTDTPDLLPEDYLSFVCSFYHKATEILGLYGNFMYVKERRGILSGNHERQICGCGF
jgi:hypothetical protein